MSAPEPRPAPSFVHKLELAVSIWALSLRLRLALRRRPLPAVVEWLERPAAPARLPMPPRRLGRVVWRVLHAGPFRARCLITSLALFRLLRRQGERPELVLGLPSDAKGHRAHAWVELEGLVVGPPPGRMEHRELARYGRVGAHGHAG